MIITRTINTVLAGIRTPTIIITRGAAIIATAINTGIRDIDGASIIFGDGLGRSTWSHQSNPP